MRRWVGLATAVGVLALVASALVAALVPRTHERVLPWSDSLPTPVRYVPAAPQSALTCTDSDVRLSAAEPMGVNSAESLYLVEVRSVGARSCFLEGRPRIDVPRRASGAISIADATGVELPLPPRPRGFPCQRRPLWTRPWNSRARRDSGPPHLSKSPRRDEGARAGRSARW